MYNKQLLYLSLMPISIIINVNGNFYTYTSTDIHMLKISFLNSRIITAVLHVLVQAGKKLSKTSSYRVIESYIHC